jgi:hypothetical protein
LYYWFDLSAKEQSEFDYLDTTEKQEQAHFFRYRGRTYCLDQFMPVEGNGDLQDWDGYYGDSYFSGILIKWTPEFDGVTAATYYS